ncbi:MAG: type VI secretion system contractile sheath small subunit [Desulfovibrio sp.]|jgi:type VI secretion system protein ImpB|nr:type VI secretion system contractile sheath small subunit [Desulfovibrio sp.]
MARESSIAPKERINVTFKPATGGAQEEIELPLKVMIMGDFLHRYDERSFIDRKPVAVNKNNYDDVMTKQELNLQLAVPNRLLDADGENDLSVNLSFKNIRDFEPEGVARQIPEMRKLLELREALVSLKGPLGNIPSFRKAIEEVLTETRQRDQVMKELGLTAAGLAAMVAEDGSEGAGSGNAPTNGDDTGDNPQNNDK